MTNERTIVTKTPDAAITAAAPIIAGRDYPDYEEDRDFTEKVLDVASPHIRADFMDKCVNEFLDIAVETEIPDDLAKALAEVFRSFAQRERERGQRVAEAHGRQF